MSRSTFRRRLNELGHPWIELKRAERLRRLRAIMESNRPIDWKKAREVCGFCETNSFYRFFRQEMGVSWRQWRQERQAA
jgi:AraC-like DNA-binding protein